MRQASTGSGRTETVVKKSPPIPADIWALVLRFLEMEVPGRIVLHVAPGGLVRRVNFEGGRRSGDEPGIDKSGGGPLPGN
jgi:hypothetical protein